MRPAHFRAYDPGGTVIVEMALPADRPVRFEAAEPVAYIVFYDGPGDDAAVMGRQDQDYPRPGPTWVDWSHG